LFWRPPLRGDPEANEHESILGEAAAIFAEALGAGYSGILFGRARQSVERMLLDVRRLVGPELANRISAYKSGYRVDERAQIEAGLRSGQLRGVVSTNALELGIDVGSLDLAVLAGYPGSTMSFWQQAGRVGRRGAREAVVVFVAGDDALDQFHIQHPDAFFGRAMEHAAVDPSNASIQLGHLLCAAAEAPLRESELELWPASARGLVQRLVDAGELSDGPPWRCASGARHFAVAVFAPGRAPRAGHHRAAVAAARVLPGRDLLAQWARLSRAQRGRFGTRGAPRGSQRRYAHRFSGRGGGSATGRRRCQP
jgi:DEAD/DEAH box helicase domain-containing protein